MKISDDATTILRNLPEAFWDVTCWSQDGQDHIGNNLAIDIADRRRIVEKILSMVMVKDSGASKDGEWGYVCRADEMGY